MASAHVKPLIGGGGGRRRGGRGFHTLFLILVYSAMVAECRELTVGDQMGWTNYDKRSFQVPDYVQWASRQQVRVGDQLGEKNTVFVLWLLFNICIHMFSVSMYFMFTKMFVTVSYI